MHTRSRNFPPRFALLPLPGFALTGLALTGLAMFVSPAPAAPQ